MKQYEIKSITDEEIMDSTFDYKVEADKETVLPEGFEVKHGIVVYCCRGNLLYF
ncbi:MAG: hypothetical protein IKP60_07015 [Treponema sp.]|nr:hypothetical protein [Treponema sp.]